MSSNLLVDDVAELGSEEEDEDFDEETGEVRTKSNGVNGGVDDSSEEEEEDDDEEAAAAVREGFIVDEDEDEEEARERRRARKKRRRAEREEEEVALDEEDLDLIGEAIPDYDQRQAAQSKYKRLKRGHREDRISHEPRGVEEIFSDDDEGLGDEDDRRRDRHALADEFADFIEEDEFEDDINAQLADDLEVQQPGRKRRADIAGLQDAGLDEAAAEDMRAAFGDGHEYDWALLLEDEDQEKERDKELELKDVFEPSQLVDRMLTDEDNEIRVTDVPERYQLARAPFRPLELSEDDLATRMKEEALWISNMLLPKKTNLPRYYVDPFRQSVRKVLEFMNIEDYEVPFIFQHRKDYLIHGGQNTGADEDDPDAPPPGAAPERLLNQNDLWEIVELDLKFRALSEKRDTLRRTYDNLKSIRDITDSVFEEMISNAVSMEEVQDIQDYLHFQYAAELKDINTMEAQTNGTQRRAQASKSLFERLRASPAYGMVRAFGITADSFAQNALATGHRQYTEDPPQRPDDLADTFVSHPEYSTGELVLRAAKSMYAEEMVISPRMRKLMRQNYYTNGLIDCFRTEKGLRKIGEDDPYYEFKYLRRQDFAAMARKPELFLRMLKAEDEGLVDVKIRMDGYESFKRNLYQLIESDNFSEIADAWNVLRREAVDLALAKLEKLIVKGVKETLKAECENALARNCREQYSLKLDQAPYKPKGMMLGTVPRVLALTNGQGVPGRDATCWAFVEEDGRVMENGKFTDLRLGNPEKYLADGKDVKAFIELVQRRKPDVIAVAGFSVETRKLYKDLQDLVERHDLRGSEYEDDDGNEVSDKLDVIIANDEVARLYHMSDRSTAEYPAFPPLTKYCIALAKYLQSPLKEYAALGRDIVSISFDPNQSLIPQEKLLKYLETAMVDLVNLVGVEINDAVNDPYLANLLPYICGLGPRKANQLLKIININGGSVGSRSELAGDPDRKILGAVGPVVFNNCASFLYIDYDSSDPEADYLDNTRVHPEDYELGRKMAADALEMDEEDIKAEVDELGPAAVVRKLVRDEAQEKVNDLILEEYAAQLEANFNQRKRATLETIRAELQVPYEELRRNFALCTTEEIFTMLTGEVPGETLAEGMIVPVKIRRTFPDHIEVKLDCGIEGGISETEYPDGVGGDRGIEPRQIYQINQTVRAKILFINRKALTAQLSLREEMLRRPYRKEIERLPGEWDHEQEAADKKAQEKEKDQGENRTQRVVNHPLFMNLNAKQAEDYLVGKDIGQVVIRPSSKGLDHLVVTWKVADNVYQHLDILEMDKENEFSLGKTLKIGGKYTYTDLDELIVNHIEAMAKKVREMMKDERYQTGTKAATDQWLKTYTEANPKRSMYAFCINTQYPGYFHLCFMQGQYSPLDSVNIKVVPNAFELARNQYPDMNTLKNGFKTLIATGMRGVRR